MAVSVREALANIDAAIERQERNESIADEALRLSRDFREFTKAAWPLVMPARLVWTWHIDTLCEHLQAAYDREITRLLVTIPPGYLKSSIFSVLGPAWEWTRDPSERLVTASHSDDLATRDTRRSRMLMQTHWYQVRWPDVVFSPDENLKTRYSNTRGGSRVRTHVGGGTGDRGSILQLDDPHNAQEAASDTQMRTAIDWWSDTWASRLDDSIGARGVKIVIGQRIHEADLIGHLLANDEDAGRWTHLCLPLAWEAKHPHRTARVVKTATGREIQGDVRETEGELLAPGYADDERVEDRLSDMTASTRAAQYQQRPAPREGAIFKRGLWRYYPPEWSFYRQSGPFTAAVAAEHLPRFQQLLTSWDTSVKDRAKSDFVSGQAWGVVGADRWLLRLYHARAGLNATIEAMLEMAEWMNTIFPGAPVRHLIEASANGPDAVREIRSRVEGVISVEAKGSKEVRAEAASPALDGRNVFVPGFATPEGDTYDPRTPFAVQSLIEEAATFPQGVHDDQVDALSQLINWTRAHRPGRGTLSRPKSSKAGRPSALPA